MFYSLVYKVVPDYIEKRVPFRKAHFDFFMPYFERGELVMGGGYEDANEGVQIVFKVDDIKTVEDFATNDPYVTGGVATSWKVLQWNVAIGQDRFS